MSARGPNEMHESTSIPKDPTFLVDAPSIEIKYRFLTRESLQKLKDSVHKWLSWQSQELEELLLSDKKCKGTENGVVKHCPQLYLQFDKKSMDVLLEAWEEIPGPQRKEPDQGSGPHKLSFDFEYEAENVVPVFDYDVGHILEAKSISGLAGSNGQGKRTPMKLPSSRCFNCSSFSHSLSDCPKPRDESAISEARGAHNGSRGTSSNVAGVSANNRYHRQASGKNKGGQKWFGDLSPGCLSTETRAALGINEVDPPPWLSRMQELGYPPDYLVPADSPKQATLEIFDEPIGQLEEGEIPDSDDEGNVETGALVPSVLFPGLNAPIPVGADSSAWTNTVRSWDSELARFPETTRLLDRESDLHRPLDDVAPPGLEDRLVYPSEPRSNRSFPAATASGYKTYRRDTAVSMSDDGYLEYHREIPMPVSSDGYRAYSRENIDSHSAANLLPVSRSWASAALLPEVIQIPVDYSASMPARRGGLPVQHSSSWDDIPDMDLTD